MLATTHEILDFWFRELDPSQWWKADSAIDAMIAKRFARTLVAATACELYSWRVTPQGRLAEVIVLDQFSRNIHRGTAAAFAADSQALALAQEAVSLAADQTLPVAQRAFLYMPYMHSESLAIHALAEQLFSQSGLADHLNAERQHQAIIARFGRYPHRNAILSRKSTAAEEAYLAASGAGF